MVIEKENRDKQATKMTHPAGSIGGNPCCCIQVLGSRDSALRAKPPVDPPTCIDPSIVISSYSLHFVAPLQWIRFGSVWILLLRWLYLSETRSPHCTGAACQLAPGRADPESETGGGGGALSFQARRPLSL